MSPITNDINNDIFSDDWNCVLPLFFNETIHKASQQIVFLHVSVTFIQNTNLVNFNYFCFCPPKTWLLHVKPVLYSLFSLNFYFWTLQSVRWQDLLPPQSAAPSIQDRRTHIAGISFQLSWNLKAIRKTWTIAQIGNIFKYHRNKQICIYCHYQDDNCSFNAVLTSIYSLPYKTCPRVLDLHYNTSNQRHSKQSTGFVYCENVKQQLNIAKMVLCNVRQILLKFLLHFFCLNAEERKLQRAILVMLCCMTFT